MKNFPVIVAVIGLVACLAFGFAFFGVSQSGQSSVAAAASYPLHLVAVSFPETIDDLVSQGAGVNTLDDHGATPLGQAAMHQKHAAVAKLLAHDADPNIVSERQDPPLTHAARWGNVDTAQLLIDHGADVNAVSMSRTALHEAITYGHNEVVALLLAQPAIDLNGRELGTGYTPLHTAVQHERLAIVGRLLELGADPKIQDQAGNTPHDLAAHKTDRSIAECFADGR